MASKGGAREGAGRKPKAQEERIREIAQAAIIGKYGSLEEGMAFLLTTKEPSLIKFVFEHGVGKPADNVNLGGGLTIQLTRKVVK